jgi:uncharacterized repeat protein (TIGR01451 family)
MGHLFLLGWRLLACIALSLAFWSTGEAQIPQRYLGNPSFEVPNFNAVCTGGGNNNGGPVPVRGYLAAPEQPLGAGVNPLNVVPSWLTTSTDTNTNGFMCTGVATGVYRPTQIFRGDTSTVALPGAGADGVQYAELNPEVESRIYQRVCVTAGETFRYSWFHRARLSVAGAQQSRAVLCRNGAGFTQAVECGGVLADTYAVGPVVTGVTTAWTLHSGTFVASVPAATTAEFGFESVLPAGSAGNLIDNAQVYMRPLIDFRAPAPNTLAESGTNNTLTWVVNGILYSTATVVITRAGSPLPSYGKYLADYTLGAINRGSYAVNTTTGNITLTLPAGIYNPNAAGASAEAGVIAIPMLVVDDNVVEQRETVTFTMSNANITGGGGTAPSGVLVQGLLHNLNSASSQCAAPTSAISYAIEDNDLPLLTKAFTPSTTLQGQSTTLVFTLTNPAETALGTDRSTGTLTVSLIDLLPAGIRTYGGPITYSAACAGTLPPSVPANSNTIAINGATVAGNPSVPGAGSVTCTISVPVIGSPTFSNASCAGNPPNFTNVAGSVTVTGLTNTVAPACLVINAAASLSVTKTDGTGTLTAGTTTTYTLTFTNSGPATADGAVIADTPGAGLSNCSVVAGSCVPSGAAACPASFASFFSTGTAIPTFGAGSSVTLLVRCGVTATGF